MRDGPQAFFLPLDQVSTEKSDFIDLETTTDKEATDLQEALRKKRPGKIEELTYLYIRLHVCMFVIVSG